MMTDDVSAPLGVRREIALGPTRIRYAERGSGPVVLFVHGVLVNGVLWRKVVPAVAAAGYRCITPDWPLGAHRVAVPDADLSPPGVADLIAEFLTALDLRDVTVVANDTGGALTQLLMVRHPERIARVVLTPSDCFEYFFPWMFTFLRVVPRVPGGVRLMTRLLGVRALHRLPFVLGWVARRPIPAEVTDRYSLPARTDPAIRRDLRRFLLGVDKRHTLAAAGLLPGFTRPVRLLWATEDRLFPLELAHRLARLLPDATVGQIGDSYTFVPEDQPAILAQGIIDFVAETEARD